MATVSTHLFELVGADGGPLRGEVRTAARGANRPAVLICHGFKGFKDWGFFPHIATRLARAGITTVSFNFSGSGIGPDGESFSEAARFGHATISNDLADLEMVAGRARGGNLVDGLARPSELGVFGHSRGGGVAVLYAARHPELGALVTWAAVARFLRWDAQTIERWRADGRLDIVNARTGDVLPLYPDFLDDLTRQGEALDPERAAAAVAAPWLIVHGAADESVPAADAECLYGAGPPATTALELVAGGSHTLGARHPWAGSTPQLDRAMELTVEWFGRHLF